MQAFTRITESICSCLINLYSKVDVYFYELIEGTMKERDESE